MALPAVGNPIGANQINVEGQRSGTANAPLAGSGATSEAQAGSLVKLFENASPSGVSQSPSYAYSDFYGKSFSTVKDFQSSDAGSLSPGVGYVCDKTTSYTYSHNGSGTYPAAGNSVFDENDDPLASGFYKIMGTTNVYRIILGTVASGWPQNICST